MSTVDKLNKVLETKQAIKEAIESKGQTVGDVFADYPTAIQNIEGSTPFVVPEGMRFAHSKTVTEFPEDWDWSEVENATDVSYMFYWCSALTKFPNLKIRNATNMSYMFNYCKSLQNLDLTEWDTSNVTNISYVFAESGITTVPKMDTSNVTNFDYAFQNCKNIVKVDELNTSKGSINNLFYGCENLQDLCEIDATSYNPSYISEYSSPLYDCKSLRNFGGFKEISVNTYMKQTYSISYESLLNVINGLADGVSGQTLYLFQDAVNQLSDEDIAIATNKGWTISPAKTITEPIVVTDMSVIPTVTYQITPRTYDFSQYTGSRGIPNNVYSFTGNFDSATSFSNMFSNKSYLKYLNIYNTSNVTKMSAACSSNNYLLYVNTLDWDTSNVTTMYACFSNNPRLTSLDLSTWDTSKVTDMRQMFYGCSKLISVTMKGDVSNVTNVTDMFGGISTEGTFYYNPAYDYSAIIAVLPSTWTAVPLTE